MTQNEFIEKIKEIEKESSFKLINLNNYHFVFDGSKMAVEKETNYYPLKDYNGFLERIGLNCSIITDSNFLRENKKDISELINKVLVNGPTVYSKSYFRGNTILACHSKDYKPLEISELVSTLKKKLNEKYQFVSFGNGFYSDELTIVDFFVEDKKIIKAYEKALFANSTIKDIKVVIRLTTSNLGLSGANLTPLLFYKKSKNDAYKCFPLTDGRICLKHDGDASIEKFAKNCEMLFPMVEMLPSELEKLNDIYIEYPTHCIINLAEKAKIPAKKIKNIAEDVSFVYCGCKPTARDLMQHFISVIDTAENDTEKNTLTERVAKALRILKEHPDEVDIPKVKWKRLGVLCDEGQEFIPSNEDEQLTIRGVA